MADRTTRSAPHRTFAPATGWWSGTRYDCRSKIGSSRPLSGDWSMEAGQRGMPRQLLLTSAKHAPEIKAVLREFNATFAMVNAALTTSP